ncbi:MAG: hypothetical protein RIS31_745 [Actinomycetota bacterium]|jgi:hypothetical protein
MNKCSRVGCTNVIEHQVIWRNPKIHQDGREKNWGSCKEHLDYFITYLTVRGFLIRVDDVK